jgi:hypothetical protein
MSMPRKTFLIKTLMRKSGVSSTLIRTLFHIREEELKKLIQLMVGPTQLEDLLFLKMSTKRKISLTRTSMKKSGDSLTPIRTLFLTNKGELRRLIQSTVGPTHQADSLFPKMLTPRKISLIKTLTKRSGDLLMPTKTPFLTNTGELKRHIQSTDGPIQQVDSL